MSTNSPSSLKRLVAKVDLCGEIRRLAYSSASSTRVTCTKWLSISSEKIAMSSRYQETKSSKGSSYLSRDRVFLPFSKMAFVVWDEKIIDINFAHVDGAPANP